MKKVFRALCALLCLALLIPGLPAARGRAEVNWQSLPYWIGVDIANQRTTIYRTSDNSVVHCWICSTGAHNKTPLGTFYLPEAKGRERSEWFSFTNSWVKYCVRYTKGLYFHSVIYHERREGTQTPTSVHNLGKPVSHGCVRLKVPAARWLCYNCPTGTRVIIHRGVDDPSIVAALGHSAATDMTDTSGLPGSVHGVTLAADGPTDLNVGQTVLLTAGVVPSTTFTSFTWRSANKKVATVNASGLVTAVGNGKAKITVTSANNKSASLTVNVTDPGLPGCIWLDRTGTVTLPIGATLPLKAAMSPSTAVSDLTWTSAKPRCATVDGNGLVTAVAEGRTTIRVQTRNRKKASVKIQVVDPCKPTSIDILNGGPVTLKVGQTLALKTAVAPGTAVPGVLTWRSNKRKVATVDGSGLVTALRKGRAKITVKTRNGKKAAILVNVVA